MKKIIFCSLVLSSILLSGCFGGEENNGERKTLEGFRWFETSDVAIQIPNEWIVLTSAKLPQGLPKNTLAAFRSNIPGKKFTANISVTQNNIPQAVATMDYAAAMKEGTLKHLISSKEIRTDDVYVSISGERTATVFILAEGRERADADLKNFMQMVAVDGKTGYVVTGAYAADEAEETVEKMEKAVKSFLVR